MSKNKSDKKKRAALAAREAELRAELERRAAKKAAKKKGKKAPKKGGDYVNGVRVGKLGAIERSSKKAAKKLGVKTTKLKGGKVRVDHIPEPTADEIATVESEAARLAEEAAAAAKEARAAARAAAATDAEERAKPKDKEGVKAQATADTDAAIKKRLAAKRARRAELEAEAATIDRADADAVRAYNAQAVLVGLTLLTSDEEKAKTKKALGKKPKPTASSDVDKGGLVADAEAHAAQVAEVVETDHGREIVVGPESVDFAQPSEAPRRFEDNTNGNGQYKVKRLDDGKEVGYTRVTTYIDCLTDRTMLEKWKARIVLEGVAAMEENGENAVTAKVRDLVHTRDVTIAKGRKSDRKGKLGLGQLEAITSAAWSEFKKALDKLGDEVFEVGGGREKAAKGTDIHELCALAVAEGIDAVGDKLTAGEITPADLADVEAFLAALKKLGAKIIAVEKVVVIDELKVAGRLDYILIVTLPGMTRGTRLVADLKTGRVDLGPGKIAQQLDMYSSGKGYDEASGDREDLKLSRTKALLFHLPAGSAKCSVHVVDLGAGRFGNKLAGEVRAWRNTSKKSIDLDVDLLELADQAAE